MTDKDLSQLLEDALTGHGARRLTAEQVEALNSFAAHTPYRLQITEAFMIEPDGERPMFEYSLSGPLPASGEGVARDRGLAIEAFRDIVKRAAKETHPVMYHVWFRD